MVKFWQIADGRGRGEFSGWRDGLSNAERAVLDEKMRKLEIFGADGVSFWKGVTGHGRINKLHITTPEGALRPLVCRGPHDVTGEITLLLGAFEENRDWRPRGAPGTADRLRQEIIANQRTCIEYEVPKP